MYKKILIFSLALLLIQHHLFAQGEDQLSLKDGIYLNYLELANDSPAFKLKKVEGFRDETSRVCLDHKEQFDILENNNLSLNDIWGFTVNGKTYINLWQSYYTTDAKKVICFYKLQKLDALSIFITEEEPATINASSFPLVLVLGPPNTNHSRIKIEEFIYELNSGRVLSMNDDYHEIKKIIKSDEQFAKARITRKNLVFHIHDYNRQNLVTKGK